MKKIIALILSVCMMLSCLTILAAETTVTLPTPGSQTFTTASMAGEIVIPCADQTGEWKTSNAIKGYNGGKHIYSAAAGCSVTYPISGIKAGNYEVYFWTMPHSKSSAETVLDIHHNGKVSYAAVYSKTNGEELAPGWVSMGIYDFAGKGDEKAVQISNDQSDRASAIKLVPTKDAVKPGNLPLETRVPATEAPAPAPAPTPAPTQPAEDTVTYPTPDVHTFTTEKFAGEIVTVVTEQIGSWRASNAVKAYSGKHIWTQTEGDYVTYVPKGLSKGNYEVYYWAMPYGNNEDETVIDIYHNGKKSQAAVYTRGKPETYAPGWVSVGIYDFAGKEDEKVMQVCVGDTVRANAVKFVPTTSAVKAGLTPISAKDVTLTTPAEPTVPETPATPSNAIDAFAQAEPVPALSASHAAKSVHVGSTGECIMSANWKSSTAASSPMMRATHTFYVQKGTAEDTILYKPQLTTPGKVRISVYGVYYKADLVTDVRYDVYYAGKTDEKHVDLSKLTENKWVVLGTYDFAGDAQNEYVKLSCVDSNGTMRASTVMFEYLNDAGDAVTSTHFVTPDVDLNKVQAEKLATLAPLNKFTDMVGHWANYDVEYMANEGLVSGKGEGIFDPEAQITRAEYVTILDRALGFELTNGESYADVDQNEWFAPYVATAKANGLLNGLPTDEGFKPNQPITRQEMALFTYNAIRKIGKNDEWLKDMPDSYANFTDTDSVSDWAEEALKYLIKTGIIKGTSDTTVSALDNANRAQGAVILKRFMQMFVWAGPPTDEEWVLTFSDEFNGNSVDWSVWMSQANTPSSGISRWPENVIVKDGAVHLEIQKRDDIPRGWTSGNIWVRPEVFRQSYGYWEARYKITPIPFANNSFWTHSGLLPLPEVTDDTLKYELDINEGKYPNAVDITYHHYKNGHEKDSVRVESEYDLSADYHVYALRWTPDELVFYFDGKEALRCPNLDHVPVYPLLSSAIMTNCGEMRNFDAEGKAQIVDYVRIWQRPADAENPAYTMIGERVEGLGPTDAYPVKTAE